MRRMEGSVRVRVRDERRNGVKREREREEVVFCAL